MPRYIDADALRKKILNTRFAVCYDLPWNRWWIKKSIGVVNKILEIIKEFPPANVEEVKHEEWRVNCGLYTCSNCGVEIWGNVFDEWKFCPYCGAKMDGKKGE